MDTYEIGDYVRRWCEVIDLEGNSRDVSHLEIDIVDPVGRLSVNTYPNGNIRRLSVGKYCWDMIAATPGEWCIKWTASDGLLPFNDRTQRFYIAPNITYKLFPRLTDGDLELIPLASHHLELLRSWRNRDDIRRWFFSSDVISEVQQLDWYYYTYQADASDLMWVANLDGKPIGTGALTHIDKEKSEAEWSRLMIGDDSARGKGVAHRIAALVRDYGLNELKLDRIYGSLYTDNAVTLHIDTSAGYMPYKVEGDITYVELLRKDWRK